MELKINCPYCETQYVVDDSVIGRTVRCEFCDVEFVVGGTDAYSLPKEANNASKNYYTNSGKKTSADYNRPAKFENWIKDFFDFKVMMTPTLVKLSFIFIFVGSSLAILAFPFEADNMSTESQYLLFFVILFVGIPIWAIVLHTLYELTMVPFLILENLTEIRNKLDEKTKS